MKNTALNIHKIFIVINEVINGLFFFDQKLSENFQYYEYNNFIQQISKAAFHFQGLFKTSLDFRQLFNKVHHSQGLIQMALQITKPFNNEHFLIWSFIFISSLPIIAISRPLKQHALFKGFSKQSIIFNDIF